MNIIYHNPNWSKSRKSVEILENAGIEFSKIQYLKDVPTINRMKDICSILGIRPKELIRKSEKIFKENNLSEMLENDNELIAKMVQYPKLIERPIIIINNKGVIGRPPEKIFKIL